MNSYSQTPHTLVERQETQSITTSTNIQLTSLPLPSNYAPRCCHRSIHIEPYLIIMGGEDAGSYFHDIHVFNTFTREWSTPIVLNHPAARTQHGVVYRKRTHSLVILYGYSENGHMSDVLECCMREPPHKWEWKTVPTLGTSPPALCGHSVVYHEKSDSIIMFGGGKQGQYHNDIFVLNMETYTWQICDPINLEYYRHRCPKSGLFITSPRRRICQHDAEESQEYYPSYSNSGIRSENAGGVVFSDLDESEDYQFDSEADTSFSQSTFASTTGDEYSQQQAAAQYVNEHSNFTSPPPPPYRMASDFANRPTPSTSRQQGHHTYTSFSSSTAPPQSQNSSFNLSPCLPHIACKRGRHTAVLHNDNEMIIFGGFSRDTGDLSDCWKFIIDERRWQRIERKGDAPTARSNHDAMLIGNYMYIYGGDPNNVNIYYLDLRTHIWHKINCDIKLVPRWGHSTDFRVCGDRINFYAVSGCNNGAEIKFLQSMDVVEVPVPRSMNNEWNMKQLMMEDVQSMDCMIVCSDGSSEDSADELTEPAEDQHMISPQSSALSRSRKRKRDCSSSIEETSKKAVPSQMHCDYHSKGMDNILELSTFEGSLYSSSLNSAQGKRMKLSSSFGM